MGLANTEQSLSRIRIVTEFIPKPEWTDVFPMFGNNPSRLSP